MVPSDPPTLPIPERRPRPGLLPTLTLLALCAVVVVGCGDGPRRVPSNPDWLRYRFSTAAPMGPAPQAALAADFDGDGVDEMVRFVHGLDRSSYVDWNEPAEDRIYTLHTNRTHGFGEVCGITDLTGDGTPEVVWYEQEGGTRRGTLVVDEVVKRGRTLTTRALSTMDLVYTDPVGSKGDWITSVFLIGAFDLDGNGTRESLVCPVVTGVALAPRGIWLLNWETREIVWRCPTAGTATGGKAVADVDGDGTPEIVVGLESPGNRVTVGDWSDTLSYVAVFELDGTVLWWREIGGYSSDVKLDAGDLDGDGSLEVVTAVGTHAGESDERMRAAVWRGADGTLLADFSAGVHMNGVTIVPCETGPRAFVGSSDGVVRRLRFDGAAIIVEGETDCGEAVDVLGVASFRPAVEGAVILAGLKSGSLVALDTRLRPLARLPLDDASNPRTLGSMNPARFRVGGRVVEGIHYVTEQRHRKLFLERNPLPLPLRVVLSVAAILAVVGGVPVLRRGTVGIARRLVLPRASREVALDELVGALATASHGKLTATSTFRRLREQASMLTLHEAAPPPAFAARFREAVENAREIGLPLVRDILAKSARLGIAPGAAGRLTGEIRELSRIVSRPTDAIPTAAGAVALRDRLDTILPGVNAQLEAIKRAVDRERSSSLWRGIGRAVAARKDDLASAGIVLSEPAAPEDGGPRVAATAAEVVFVIENLIANAARAVEGVERPRIGIGLSLDGRQAVVTVEDNGKGIAPERQTAVFEEGVSDRAGGGHGLAESRRILAVRGGSIRVARSAPGEGTVFEVRLRVVA